MTKNPAAVLSPRALEIYKASAKGFQRNSTLKRKYGLEFAAYTAEIDAAFPYSRMRVFGPEGGLGPR